MRLPAIALLLLCGCPRPQTVAGPAVDAAALYEQAQKAHAGPWTLAADAKAFVEAPQNGGRYALHVSVERPRSLRLEALTPLGDPAAVLVADQGDFALLDLRNNVFYRGPATPQNLSRLLPEPLRDDELVSLLTGAIPELPGSQPTEARRDGDGYVLTQSAPGGRQRVWLGADLRVGRVRRETEGGALIWEAGLDDHDGALSPRQLRLDAPPIQTKVDLRLRNVAVGQPPPRSAFLLAPPPGVPVEEVR